MSEESSITKVGLAFYPSDEDALSKMAKASNAGGVAVRRGTILRALIYHATHEDMIANALQVVAAYALKQGPREDELVISRPTVELPSDQLKKLDRAVSTLARQGVTVTRILIVRSLIRAAPTDHRILPILRKFLTECPPRAKGWAVRNARIQRG